jgi:hypothetical protein
MKGRPMNKIIAAMGIVVLVSFSSNSYGAPTSQDLKKAIDSAHFKHAWKVQTFFDSYELLSPFTAPFPFTTKSEPEAEIIVAIPPDKVSPETPMEKILQDQISQIQKNLRITDYLEKDRKPVNNIVSYTQKVGSSEVGILQYRSLGEKEDPPDNPVSVKQILFVKGNQLYNVVLMVLYAGHQDEVRADQMELVKALLQSKL